MPNHRARSDASTGASTSNQIVKRLRAALLAGHLGRAQRGEDPGVRSKSQMVSRDVCYFCPHNSRERLDGRSGMDFGVRKDLRDIKGLIE